MARTPLAGAVQDAVAAIAAGRAAHDARRASSRKPESRRSASPRSAASPRPPAAPRRRRSSSSAPASPASAPRTRSGTRATRRRSTRRRTGSAAAAGRCAARSPTARSASTAASSSTRATPHIRQLAQELGLKLDNLLAGRAERHRAARLLRRRALHVRRDDRTTSRPPGRRSTPTSRRRATRRTFEISTAARAASSTTCRSSTGSRRRSRAGSSSRIGQFLDVAYNIEYGAESAEQSSLNLLYLLGYRGPGNFRLFGASNEKYHVAGGNDQITDRLAAALAGQITTGSELVAVRAGTRPARSRSRSRSGSGTKTVTADKVVLALPFSILRSSVDLSKAGFEPLQARRDPRAGHGHELEAPRPVLEPLLAHARLERRDVLRHAATRTPGRSRWRSRARAGILVDYTGGNDRRELRLRHARRRGRSSSSPSSSRCCPGRRRRWNGRATIDFWPGYRVDEGLVLVLEGRPVPALRRDGGAARRATASSPASTRRSTSRAT